MLTPTELRSLKEGNVVRLGWALEGLAPDEGLFLKLKNVNRDKELFHFTIFYFDVPCYEYAAKIQTTRNGSVEEKVLWQREDKD